MQARRDALPRLDQRSAPAHAGLVLTRYLNDAVANDDTFRRSRADLQNAACRAGGVASALYRQALARWKQTLVGEETASDVFRVQGRLVIGLGGAHVLETGLTLHHTYGMPILPGTALKGLAAHYCDRVWAEKDKEFRREGQHYRVLFGVNDDAGQLRFHDAWFEISETTNQPHGLVADVLTPHHGDYYGGEADALPTDFDDPNPVSFLSVCGAFFIAVSHESGKGKAWANVALELLTAALEDWGIGGKTSSGYGRLVREGAKQKPSLPPKPVPRTPSYKTGGRVTVTRTADPNPKKNRAWFTADDGFGGVVTQGAVPDVALGETTTLEIAAVNQNGYNFRRRE